MGEKERGEIRAEMNEWGRDVLVQGEGRGSGKDQGRDVEAGCESEG